MYCTPGPDSSSLINTEKAVPNSPENNAKIKYRVPMSFALLERNHLSNHIDICELFDSNSLSCVKLDIFSNEIGLERLLFTMIL